MVAPSHHMQDKFYLQNNYFVSTAVVIEFDPQCNSGF